MRRHHGVFAILALVACGVVAKLIVFPAGKVAAEAGPVTTMDVLALHRTASPGMPVQKLDDMSVVFDQH